MDQNTNPFWDEHRWEAHLNSLEIKSEKRKSFVNNSWGDKEPVWLRFLREFEDVEEALESYLDDELTYEESYFPDDLDELDEDEEDVDEDIFLTFLDTVNMKLDSEKEFEEPYILDPAEELDIYDLEFGEDEDDEDEDFDEGEEWKATLMEAEFDLEEFTESEDPYSCYIVYDEARELSIYFMKRTLEFPDSLTNDTYNRFMYETLQTTSKFAAALAFDHYDATYLGAIITYCKRALTHANTALELLRLLKHEQILHEREYNPLQVRFFEFRNNLGLLIQEMREHLANNQA